MKRRDVLKTAGIVLGYSLTAGTAAAVLAGCNADPTPGWVPTFNSEDESKILKSMAEIIIPGTDTLPGAKDIMIEKFIDETILLHATEEEKTKYKDGFSAFIDKINTSKSKSFLNLTDEEKLAEIKNGLEGNDDFIKNIHEMCITGFCTSEVGAKKVLVYDPIPGAQKGCIPLEEVGGIWAI